MTNESKPQTILSLLVENVKRLKAVRIRPDGNVVVIGGMNGQGKTSCIDSIEYGFRGRSIPGEPIRRGAKKARVICKTEDYTVTRKFSRSGNEVVVVANDNPDSPIRSPQKLLDRLAGDLTFDPLAFTRMKPSQQVETLRHLIGVDFSELDEKRTTLYERRTETNRELKAKKAFVTGRKRHEDVPAKEVSVKDLMAERQRLEAENHENETLRQERANAEEIGKRLSANVRELEDKIESIARKVVKLKKEEIDTHFEKVKKLRAECETLEDNDLSEIDAKIESSEETNRKIRANAELRAAKKKVEELEDKVSNLTSEIDEIDEQKTASIAEAKLPVDGLAFDADGVTYNGIPFDQCSSSEQTKVSLAMGMAMNPELRVILIRDGSLLDPESMQIVADMAEKNDFQVWVEVVGKDEQCSVVIEDGEAEGMNDATNDS